MLFQKKESPFYFASYYVPAQEGLFMWVHSVFDPIKLVVLCQTPLSGTKILYFPESLDSNDLKRASNYRK